MKRLLIIGAIVAVAAIAPAQSQKSKGTAVCYPWSYAKGTDTAQTTSQATVEHLARREGYSSVPLDVAKTAWDNLRQNNPRVGSIPSTAALKAFGKKVGADLVLYGSIKWHTRSIWVNIGPKTISTATVNVYVFNVKAGKVVYRKTGVQGRSDAKLDEKKFGEVVGNPVSGGPKTPQEQRAAQVALATAYRGWMKNPW